LQTPSALRETLTITSNSNDELQTGHVDVKAIKSPKRKKSADNL